MISIVYGHKRYHEMLAEVIGPDDLVLEIGPHIGGSTKVIAENAKQVIAVDKAKQSADALKDNPDISFVRGDVRFFETIDEVCRLLKTLDPRRRNVDVLAMDMGGGRFPDTVFKVWAVWSGVFKPRDSIIRNRGLGEFLRRARIDDPVLEKDFVQNGWLTQSGRKSPKQLKEGLDELQLWLKNNKSD
jgi:hypothetical protein